MPFTNGTGQPPINIIYQSSEDDADDTIVPRFLSAGGNPDHLLFISEKERYLSFSDDRLLQAIRQTGHSNPTGQGCNNSLAVGWLETSAGDHGTDEGVGHQ